MFRKTAKRRGKKAGMGGCGEGVLCNLILARPGPVVQGGPYLGKQAQNVPAPVQQKCTGWARCLVTEKMTN